MARNKVLLGGGVAIVAIAAIGAWWLGFFSSAPEEANVDDLAEAVQAQAEADGIDASSAVVDSLDGT